jgi:ABC-type uncharacterized transport system permease subunit
VSVPSGELSGADFQHRRRAREGGLELRTLRPSRRTELLSLDEAESAPTERYLCEIAEGSKLLEHRPRLDLADDSRLDERLHTNRRPGRRGHGSLLRTNAQTAARNRYREFLARHDAELAIRDAELDLDQVLGQVVEHVERECDLTRVVRHHVRDVESTRAQQKSVAGALGGAAWAAIPAFLRTRFNANEILVSLMLVYVAQLLVSWLVFGPWMDPDGFNFPQSKMFSDSALLPLLVEGTRLNLAFVMALGVLLIGYVFMHNSYLGFKMRVAGEAADAARYAGFSAKRMVWIGLLVGGACAGLAGMAEVAGPMGQLTDKVASGYGFAAIIVAFVGRLNPIGIFFASLLMALLFLGGEQAQLYLSLPASISKVFQGMLLFFLLGSDLFINYRLRVRLTLAKAGD